MSESITATRRTMLTAVAATLVATVPAVASAQQEDPELLRLGAEFEDYLVRWKAADPRDEAGFNAVMDEQWPLFSKILSRRPRTAVGIGILARAMSLSADGVLDTEYENSLDMHICLFVEAMCAFAGVEPVRNTGRYEPAH